MQAGGSTFHLLKSLKHIWISRQFCHHPPCCWRAVSFDVTFYALCFNQVLLTSLLKNKKALPRNLEAVLCNPCLPPDAPSQPASCLTSQVTCIWTQHARVQTGERGIAKSWLLIPDQTKLPQREDTPTGQPASRVMNTNDTKANFNYGTQASLLGNNV